MLETDVTCVTSERSSLPRSFSLLHLIGSETRSGRGGLLDPNARHRLEPFVVHGPLLRLGALLDIPALTSPPALFRAWDGFHGRVRAWPGPAHRGLKLELTPKRDQVEALYASGFSIYVMNLHEVVPEIAPLCRRLERDLGLPVGCVVAEAFCSTNGSGAVPHFDDTDTLNVQLVGEKNWLIAANPSVINPPRGLVLGNEPHRELRDALKAPLPLKMPADARMVSARPGTVVFIPSGTLHATRVVGDSFSLLFTIAHSTFAHRAGVRIRSRLRSITRLRASHLERRGAEESDIRIAVTALRRLADDLEAGRARTEHDDDRELRPRRGVAICALGSNTFAISMRGRDSEIRTLQVDGVLAEVLDWLVHRGPGREVFTLRELLEQTSSSPSEVRRAVRKLKRAGVLVSSGERREDAPS